MYRPYCYLIGWSKLDTWYYGAEYKRTAKPENLWSVYFTSSRYVKAFIEEHGDPDVVQVRKVFEDKGSCVEYESKVLRRLGVVRSDRWLNKTDNRAIVLSVHPQLGKPSPLKGKKGKPWSENQKRLHSEGEKGKRVWNDGTKTVRSRERPGLEWVPGRLDKPVNRVSVVVDGKEYPSIAAAREDTGMSFYTIKKRAAAPNPWPSS